MINNGKLLFEGNFKAEHFVTNGNNEMDEVKVNIKSMDIIIPKNIDMNNISVNMGLDNGNLGIGVSSKFRVDNKNSAHQISKSSVIEEEFSFTGYPNPNSGRFTVHLKLPTTQQIEVSVFNSNGSLIKSLYKGEAKKEAPIEIKADLSALLPGVYFLKLSTPDKVLVRKLLKE
jgi:hypothetical protein